MVSYHILDVLIVSQTQHTDTTTRGEIGQQMANRSFGLTELDLIFRIKRASKPRLE